ncbi:MAG: hypothetical protein HDS69_06000 [Bacteroidales bacterium]|nr:hypothetical protein [Bacteroidales bacterium]
MEVKRIIGNVQEDNIRIIYETDKSPLITELNYSEDYVKMLEDAGMDVYNLDMEAVEMAKPYTGTDINDIDSDTLKTFKYMPKFADTYLNSVYSLFY